MKTQYITPKEIESKLLKDKHTVIAVSAKWCGPCNDMTEQVWDPINEENKDIQIFKIDVEEHNDWAKRQGIKSLPTMIWFNGQKKSKESMIGFIPRKEFEIKIKN